MTISIKPSESYTQIQPETKQNKSDQESTIYNKLFCNHTFNESTTKYILNTKTKTYFDISDIKINLFDYNKDFSKTDFENYLKESSNDECNASIDYHLGICYLHGKYTNKDPDMAFQYLYRASFKGHCIAMNNLAGLFQSGLGCKKNLELAFNIYNILAKEEYPFALHNVGESLLNGLGCIKDQKKGFECLYTIARIEESNNKLNKDTASLLAKCFLKGIGCKADIEMAAKLYEFSYEAGNEEDEEIYKSLRYKIKKNL